MEVNGQIYSPAASAPAKNVGGPQGRHWIPGWPSQLQGTVEQQQNIFCKCLMELTWCVFGHNPEFEAVTPP
jgi:hypothetical protein